MPAASPGRVSAGRGARGWSQVYLPCTPLTEEESGQLEKQSGTLLTASLCGTLRTLLKGSLQAIGKGIAALDAMSSPEQVSGTWGSMPSDLLQLCMRKCIEESCAEGPIGLREAAQMLFNLAPCRHWRAILASAQVRSENCTDCTASCQSRHSSGP